MIILVRADDRLIHGMVAVSYTHLDVYKRQGYPDGRFAGYW